MSQGIPLTSLDGQIWLGRIKVEILERVRAIQLVRGEHAATTEGGGGGIILTCSALARSHRDTLRGILPSMSDNTASGSFQTVFVALQASEEGLVRRVGERKGHYLKGNMVRSQLETIERSGIHERDFLSMDAEQDLQVVFDEVVAGLTGLSIS